MKDQLYWHNLSQQSYIFILEENRRFPLWKSLSIPRNDFGKIITTFVLYHYFILFYSLLETRVFHQAKLTLVLISTTAIIHFLPIVMYNTLSFERLGEIVETSLQGVENRLNSHNAKLVDVEESITEKVVAIQMMLHFPENIHQINLERFGWKINKNKSLFHDKLNELKLEINEFDNFPLSCYTSADYERIPPCVEYKHLIYIRHTFQISHEGQYNMNQNTDVQSSVGGIIDERMSLLYACHGCLDRLYRRCHK